MGTYSDNTVIEQRRVGTRTGRFCGFSLIELLVVVAVLGVLMAVLLPALNRTRRMARRLTCGTRLRSIGLGLHLYQQDLESLPPQYDRWGPERQTYDNQYMEPWVSYVAFHQDEVDARGNLRPLQLAYLYRNGFLADSETFYCPGQPRSGANEPFTHAYYVGEGPSTWGTFLPTRADGNPDDKIRVSYHYWLHNERTLDGLGNKPIALDNIQHWDSVGHVRNGRPHGVNALFGDGHVTFTTSPALFELDLWNGGPAAGPWDGPGNDQSLFLGILDRLEP